MGLGTVCKLRSGRFQARYTGPDGIRYTARSAEGRPVTFSGRQYAAGWLSRTDADIQAGNWVSPDAIGGPAGQKLWSRCGPTARHG